MQISIIDVTDGNGRIIAQEWLQRAEPVHAQLRSFAEPYVQKLQRVFDDGARMAVAALGDAVGAVGVYRIYENTYAGRQLYVDDLVTDERLRSTGVGARLLRHLEQVARAQGCTTLALDSGTQRQRAHTFYFREGLTIASFHFTKRLP